MMRWHDFPPTPPAVIALTWFGLLCLALSAVGANVGSVPTVVGFGTVAIFCAIIVGWRSK
jgi:hypothetical protein